MFFSDNEYQEFKLFQTACCLHWIFEKAIYLESSSTQTK